MRRALTVFALLIVAGPALAADTPLARNTRTKVLKAKITLDLKQEMLNVIFDEIKGQLQDQNLPALGVKYQTGVSANQRLDVKADDTPLDEVLDQILSVNKLGYVVVSKAGDRYDGWIEITRGNERGYAAGEEPKPGEEPMIAASPEPEPMPEPEPAPEPEPENTRPARDRAQMLERIAAQHLELGLMYKVSNRAEKANKKFEFIIRVYPGTEAAAVAKQEMGGGAP